jgi:hypothetical protein
MTTCQARLPIGQRPRAIPGTTGFVRYIYGSCTQSVGVRVYEDLSGREWPYCALAGHLDDVLRQAQAAELAERVRHEVAEDDRRAAWLDDEREPVEPVEAYQ